MRLITRGEWGARTPKHTSPIGNVVGNTVHWNGVAVGEIAHGRCPEVMRTYQDYHMDSRGWADIGYSFVACRHGWVFEGRGLGVRPAHEESLNAHWYGIQAMVGEGDSQPAELYQGLRDAIGYTRSRGAGHRINGHRDADATSCPGDQLYEWINSDPMEDDMPSAREVADELLDTQIEMANGSRWQVRTILRNLERDTDPQDMFNAVWRQDKLQGTGDENERYPEWMLSQAHNRAGDVRADVRALAKALEALASSQKTAIRDAVHEALKDVSVTIDYDTGQS